MKKIYLTEDQFRKYLKRELAESVFEKGSTGRNISNFAKKMQQPVFDRLAQTYRGEVGDDNLTQNLHNLAGEHGVDMGSFAGTETSADYEARKTGLMNDTNAEQINQWVKQWLPLLRQCYTQGNTVTANFQKGFERRLNTRDAQGNLNMKQAGSGFFDTLPQNEKKEVMAVRDFLDGEGLTFLYREASIPKWPMRYGIDPTKHNWTTPVDQLPLDFGNISDYDANQFYDGTRKAGIDQQLSQYEKGSDEWNAGKIKLGIEGRSKMTVERYVERRYGMEMTYGKDPRLMKFGNAKIADDTLIVNFTSATRCPAWNECLLKDACYARVGELGHPDTRDKNNRNSIIWSQTEKDDTLLALMAQFIRACMVDYPTVAKALKPQYKDVTTESLVAKTFTEIKSLYGDEALELMRRNSSERGGNKKNNKIIRLNEDGDFIGQWLVNAWEAWARDFQLIGVTVAAYTCRALNYENIESMALNLSQEGLNSEFGNASHYFYAINEDLYNGLPETYYNRQTGDMTLDTTAKEITPMYVTLADGDGVKGYYYKCPCGRGKYTYSPVETGGKNAVAVQEDPTQMEPDDDSPKLVSFNNTFYQKVKTEFGKMADCYKCRICYGRVKEQEISVDRPPKVQGVPVYVFVKVHGAGNERFDAEHANVRKPGGRTVAEWVQILKNGGDVEPAQNAMIAEAEVEQEGNDRLAIQQLVTNAAMSVANHMTETGGYLAEAEEKFYRLFDQIDR